MALNPTTSSLYSLKPKNFTLKPQPTATAAVGPVVPSAQFPLAGRAETARPVAPLPVAAAPQPVSGQFQTQPFVAPTPTGPAPQVAPEANVAPAPSVAENFRVDFNGTFPSTALNSPVTSVDFNSLLSRNQKQVEALQQQLLNANTPTATESAVENQILALREQAAAAQEGLAQYDLATQQGSMGLEGQGRGIPAEVIRGEQENLVNQRAFLRQGKEAELTRFAQQEQNLMTRLGLEQEKRKGVVSTIKDALGFGQQELDNQLKIQQAIQSQQQQFLDQTSQLRDDARQTLGMVLQNFKGLDFADLDAQTQSQLAQLSTSTGIPFQALVAGMKIAKDEVEFERAYKTNEQAMRMSEQQFKYADVLNGTLDDTDIAKVDKSDEAKKLKTLAELKMRLQRYKDLHAEYGTALFGEPRALLESAYADLQVAWKDAAGLGALTGPDLDLLKNAVKPTTGLSGWGSFLSSGGNDGISKSIQQMIDRVDQEGQGNFQSLLKRDGRYENSEYIQNLGSKFGSPPSSGGGNPDLDSALDKAGFKGDLSTSVNGSAKQVVIPKSTLAYANNNPGNLRFVGQQGASEGKGGFARFDSPQAGYEALMRQIKLDASRSLSLGKFISKYAPATENDTALYQQQAVKALGVPLTTPLAQIPVDRVAKFMAMKESSTKVTS